MGSYLTIVNDTNDTFSIKYGPDSAALMVGTLVAGAITTAITCGAATGIVAGTIITVGTAISVGSALTSTALGIHSALNKEGFVTLKPGERHQSVKMGLSLWQQCQCIRSRQIGDDLVVQEVMMRPIFTGATADSNNDHSINWWIQKWGGTKELSKLTFKK